MEGVSAFFLFLFFSFHSAVGITNKHQTGAGQHQTELCLGNSSAGCGWLWLRESVNEEVTLSSSELTDPSPDLGLRKCFMRINKLKQLRLNGHRPGGETLVHQTDDTQI